MADAKFHIKYRYLALAIAIVVVLYVFVPQISQFRSSWSLLREPDPYWTIIAFGLTLTTYLAAAATYWLLAFKPLRYGQVWLVQLAAMFINRLLPGGIGALGVNYAYLHRQKHSPAQATTVVAINNILGGLGHGLLMAGALLIYSGKIISSNSQNHSIESLIRLVVVAALAATAILLLAGRNRFKRFGRDLLTQLLSFRSRPRALLAALVTSMCLTLSNVLCLAACAAALNVHLSVVVFLIIFSLGIGAGTATPLPGGLGGFEAGLVLGLAAYHIALPSALAVALLFRLVSYWLPLILGATAFVICQRRRLLMPS